VCMFKKRDLRGMFDGDNGVVATTIYRSRIDNTRGIKDFSRTVC
jgi:hypothetical protein